MTDVRIVPAGDSVLVAEFEERIDPLVNARAVACADALRSASIAGVRDIVPAYRSVSVYFDPLVADADQLAAALRGAAASADGARPSSSRHIEIPACYGDEFGPDLDDVARFAKMTATAVVGIHTSSTYRVFMLGFVPGFAYMGSVDPRIAAPRRAVPRTQVNAGDVGIAGGQTGIYPRRTPGGWNVIGRTPLVMASLDPSGPTLLRAGDTVTFRAIDRREFDRLAAEGRA